jgi:hypothetical protein
MNVSTEIDLNLPFIRMLIMKKNMLAVLIAGTFLVACSDGSGLSSKSIQVFDGPVQFADVVANCGGEDLDLGRTDFNGTVRSTDFVIINTPELCEFTATGTEAIGASIGASIDTSNNKLMPKISYVIPRGLLKVGDSITLSPLTTLIAKQIEANTANNITGISVSDVATEVDALDMARDMEGTITKLKAAYPNSVPLVIATNNVTSDVLVYSQTTVVGLADIIKTSTKVAEQVISVNDDYPIVSTDSTKIKVASFDVEDAVLAVENSTAIAVSIVENDIPEEPVATGATGTAG